jgi:peptidyl-prolyl cis-trans isomerase A (cyclophilin A)
VAQNAQRILGAAVFAGTIMFGMHVAGQTATPPPNGGPMIPAAPQPQVGAPADTTPANALSNLQNATGTATSGQAPQNQDGPTPAFGPGALKAADKILERSETDFRAAPAATPTKFVPSEIETIVPGQVKVGDPRAILHTSLGDITIHLYSAYAPKTVRNFIDLARGDKEFFDIKTGKGVRRPFYTNLLFHRVLADFLIQTGCPFGNGRGGPGFTIPDELSPVLRFNKPGILAMAPERNNNVPVKDTNGSQFFITLGTMPEWDDKYTIFGEVERGMSVVEKIAHTKTGPTDRPIKRIFLYNVEIFDEATANALKNQKPDAEKPPSAP